MAGTYAKVKTVVPAETITASDRNAEHDNHINNADPDGIGDASADVTEMQATADPYPGDSESLATDLRGELQRVRFQLKTQLGLTQWYTDATTVYETYLQKASTYRRPRLVYVSATQLDVEENTGTNNQTRIIFPDGDVREVTEDTSSTNVNRRFDITATASVSGTKDSGVRSGESEANNTWWCIYAVKVTDNSTDFVLIGSQTQPVQSNYSTLDTNFGTDSWVYLGLIRNGDSTSAGAVGDILSFVQAGPRIKFTNTVAAAQTQGGVNQVGIQFISAAAAASHTYTNSAGMGDAQVPSVVGYLKYQYVHGSTSATVQISDAGENKIYEYFQGQSGLEIKSIDLESVEGFKMEFGSGTVIGDVNVIEIYDSVLAGQGQGETLGGA